MGGERPPHNVHKWRAGPPLLCLGRKGRAHGAAPSMAALCLSPPPSPWASPQCVPPPAPPAWLGQRCQPSPSLVLLGSSHAIGHPWGC